MTESLKAVVLRDRSVVTVGGTDRVKFLQGLTTNDIPVWLRTGRCIRGF